MVLLCQWPRIWSLMVHCQLNPWLPATNCVIWLLSLLPSVGAVKWVSVFGNGRCRWWQPTGGLTAQVSWLGLRVDSCLALSLHSSNEPSELLQWPCRQNYKYWHYYYYYFCAHQHKARRLEYYATANMLGMAYTRCQKCSWRRPHYITPLYRNWNALE